MNDTTHTESADAQPATALQTTDDPDLVEIPVYPPRSLDCYRPTTHFGQRLRSRVPDRHHGPVPRDIISDGTVARQPLNHDRKNEPGHPVAFTGYVDQQQYTVTVALHPDAYCDPDTVHELLTVYKGKPPAAAGGQQGGKA